MLISTTTTKSMHMQTLWQGLFVVSNSYKYNREQTMETQSILSTSNIKNQNAKAKN
jgi:hypothetical protein